MNVIFDYAFFVHLYGMKIATINTVATNHNAPGRIMTQIGKASFRLGNDVLTIYGRGAAPDGIPSFRIGSGFDVMRHAAMSRLTDSEGLYSVSATKALITKLESFSPDIIHLHNIHGHYINYRLLMQWLKHRKMPVVWTLHDCWAYTGHCCYYSANRCDKWKNGCHNCEFSDVYPRSLISHSERNFVLKRNLFTDIPHMTIVSVSKWLASEIKQSFLGDYPIEIIPNGVDTGIFKPTKTSGNKPIRILGVALNWHDRKNFDFFIKLAQIMSGVEIILAGKASSCQRKTIPSNIKCIGLIPDNQQLAELYSSSDVFINPSREETFGLTTIEAMSCGVPVIVNNATALPDAITPKTGVIVDIDNIDEVMAALKQLTNNIDTYGVACRQHIIDNYSADLMTNRYHNLYQRILSE